MGGGGDILSMSHTTNQCNNVKKQSQYSILESIVIRAVKKRNGLQKHWIQMLCVQ